MENSLLFSKKKLAPIPKDENVVFLTHFDQSPPINVATNEVGTIRNISNYRVSVPQSGPPNSKFGTGYLHHGGSVSNGASESLTFPKNFTLTNRLFTIDSWHKWPSWSSGAGATCQGWTIGASLTNANSGLYLSGTRFNGGMTLRINTVSSQPTFTLNIDGLPQALPITDYFHVGIVRDVGEMRAYLNGKLAGSIAIPVATNLIEGNILLLGQSSNANQPTCQMDEMRIVMDQVLYVGSNIVVPKGPFPDPEIGT